ncbi:glucokinase [Amphibacillus marinus]|uniref:Glucokinase n=1 Tax=Amphibacillus marinus TaxID=872970 RepID=A0A1H8HFR3_9BACI|nr:ROK family glucokinase [Amphibacillus marinus]SEN54717.1 glucokinase [Amphibacillus marinus]
MSKILLGVDIGGTTIKLGMLDQEGKIIDKWEIETRKWELSDQIPGDIWSSIKRYLAKHSINPAQCLGIGIGAPGFIVAETGEVAEAVNLGWRNFPLGAILTELSNLPVYVDNDANIAALGENWLGSGQLAENLIAITLGTGVGGGIIANGKIISGVNGTAGEIGHMTVVQDGEPCNCGRKGCLETVTSATGIARIALERLPEFANSILTEVFSAKQKLTAKDVFDAYQKSDELATEVVEHVTNVLGLAIANMATIINPSKIVIGGGVSKAGNLLLSPLDKAYKAYALKRSYEGSTFEIAALGNDAGIIGGAFLVKQNQVLA